MRTSEGPEFKSLEDLLALDMEYRLTIASRVEFFGENCPCVRYFINRREVLIPEILAQAQKTNDDPVELFARYARGVHDQHG